MADAEINFSLFGNYNINNREIPVGDYTACITDENIALFKEDHLIALAPEIIITAGNNSGSFQLKDVTIGINFHWEQKEDQLFKGSLKLIQEERKIRCINLVPLEEYLQSVISSEMSATSSPDLLKAHAVISRSWLLAQIEKSKKIISERTDYRTTIKTEDELIRWYDREDHDTFDVCADDHCQRYQGITKIISGKVFKAVEDTSGMVLVYDGNICDARFSKCCGGITENFENVWEPVPNRCLTKVVDSEFGDTTCVNLRLEDEAIEWIKNSPHAFCNTSDKKILSQVLPEFDKKTTNFYRWKVEYSQKELSELIKKRSGIDFGEIIKMEAVERGHSGRLIKLKITGTKKTLTFGKELEIRKWLSESHLYSSAFIVDYKDIAEGIPQKFILTGAGWGHGVGLCQIGAAVMGEKGYSYKQILKHYFKDAELKKYY
ncbi:MAG: SpoIID/LytB domain-containing protein [Prolixibacteraceae bacterium]|nr:SpoIID/LytB domain-containing protein [Prolixibacteraceae bacterium]MBN2774834.1 SpoIID/LytB domain-containing protein [Prolixibacteraceae bacterium]